MLQPIQSSIKKQLLLEKNSFSKQLKQRVPLFSKIDSALFDTLDLTGFVIPEGVIEIYRKELEGQLGHFVVSYDKKICNLEVPVESHSCARVKGAKLSAKQKQLLTYYEQLSKPLGVTFVIYQNPIEYIDPCQSAIYSLYQKKGKL